VARDSLPRTHSRVALAIGLGLGLGLLAAGAASAEPTLRGDFWAELEPVPQEGEPWPLPVETAAERLVEEAAYVFSGMVSGFEFAYTPLDRARGLEESFKLEPVGVLERGDPRLRPGKARLEAGRLVGPVEFLADASDALELEGYGREPWKSAQGRGYAELVLGWKGRRVAYEEAAREAARSLLRLLEPNKPRLVRGRLVFASPPRVAIVDGRYAVTARCRVEVTEVLSYGVY